VVTQTVIRRALIAGVLVGAACTSGQDRFPAVEADVRRSLRLGMKVQEVIRVLDSMRIPHSPRADSGRMFALVSPVAKDLIIRTDAQFELSFDTTGTLTRINAKRILTGP
jgi:hypothetical protein